MHQVKLNRGPSWLTRYAPPVAAVVEWSRLRHAEWKLKRTAVEYAQKSLVEMGGYLGASREAPYGTWLPGGGSPDADILNDLPLLRERVRDLIRMDPHAAGLADLWGSSVAGKGLRPQSRIDHEAIGISREQALEFQSQAEKIWRRWGKASDVTGELTEAERQQITFRQIFENGDVFLIPRRVDDGRPFSLAVEIVESDRVRTPANKSSDDSVRGGIKIGLRGEPVTYFIERTHPGDLRRKKIEDFVEIPARGRNGKNVHHIFRRLRPDQHRGVPWLAPALSQFKDLSQYMRAELIAAKAAACYAIFVISEDPLSEFKSRTESKNGQKEETLRPGLIKYMRPGEKVETNDPNRPNRAFGDFLTRILRSIGTSIQTPYELVSQDFSQTTYTSGRMALTEVRRIFRWYQEWLGQKACQPFYELLLEEAFLMGELRAPRFLENFEEYAKARWIGTGWNWVDPMKEVDATVTSIDNNLSTLADELALRGIDWEEVIQQRAREQDLIRSLLTSEPEENDGDPPPPPPPPLPSEEETEDDE